MNWQPIASAPRDGTLLLLLCRESDEERAGTEYNTNPVEGEELWRTIGLNSLENTGVDEWQMAGWCWSHDHFTEGNGVPMRWMHLPSIPEDAA